MYALTIKHFIVVISFFFFHSSKVSSNYNCFWKIILSVKSRMNEKCNKMYDYYCSEILKILLKL